MNPRVRFLLIGLLSLGLSITQTPAADALDALTSVLKSAREEQVRIDVLRGMSQAMEGRNQVEMPDGWPAVETALAQSGNAEIRSLVRTLGLKFGSPAALHALKQMLQDDSAPDSERSKALEALLSVRDPGLPGTLMNLLDDPALRGAAIRALATFNEPEIPAALLDAYGSFDDAEKRDALNTLASRRSYAARLMKAVAEGNVPADSLTADLVRQLRQLDDEAISRQIEEVWGTVRDTPEARRAEIEKYRSVYWAGGSTPGDASRGRAVYAKVCQQCHMLFDEGGTVGPDLTGSNRTDIGYLLENMVDPNAVIPNEYRSTTIELNDDRVITGIVKRQDQNSVTIATANDTLVVPREEIVEMVQGELSMMPEGLLNLLSDQEVRDLIYYLRQPAQAPRPEQ